MSEDTLSDVITSEDNTAQENEVANTANDTSEEDASAEESSIGDAAERAKINAILERKNKKIAELERSIAEKESKKVDVPENKPQATETLTREEAILFAKGFSEKEINEASDIARAKGVSLTDALETDAFKGWKKIQEEKAISEQASLDAAKGSPKFKEKPTFDSKNLSPEEHKALFKQKLNRR